MRNQALLAIVLGFLLVAGSPAVARAPARGTTANPSTAQKAAQAQQQLSTENIRALVQTAARPILERLTNIEQRLQALEQQKTTTATPGVPAGSAADVGRAVGGVPADADQATLVGNISQWLRHWWYAGLVGGVLWWIPWFVFSWQWWRRRFWVFAWPWPWWWWIPWFWFIPWLIWGWWWGVCWWLWWCWFWWWIPWIFWIPWWLIVLKHVVQWLRRTGEETITTPSVRP